MARRTFIVIAVVASAFIAAPLVTAQDDPGESLREAREAREQTREEQADLARELDVLEATQEELLVALVALNDQVQAEEQAIAVAEEAVAAARAGEVAITEEIAMASEEASKLRLITQDRAVAAYIAPRDDPGNEGDITLQARREALYRYVHLDGRDLLDQLRAVEDDLDVLQAEAETRRNLAIALQADLESALERLRSDVAAQKAIRAQLGATITELEAEIGAMAAAEVELSAIIRDALREIARDAALARAATSTTTSPPTTTTTAKGSDPSATTTTTAKGSDSSATTTTAVDTTDLALIWPTTGSVTSSFGTRVHPITGHSRDHTGLDIGNVADTSVWAAESGTVIYSGRLGGYGETVIVDHGSGVTTVYAHMSSRSVAKATSISQGAEVGKMGSTGYSTGPHLHFEIRLNNTAVNPQAYLS